MVEFDKVLAPYISMYSRSKPASTHSTALDATEGERDRKQKISDLRTRRSSRRLSATPSGGAVRPPPGGLSEEQMRVYILAVGRL